MDTTMAEGLHITQLTAGYDAACKRVLSEKAILSRIMKACLEEYKDCDVNDIAEKYIEGQPQVSSVPVLPDQQGSMIHGTDTVDKTIHEGTVTYDIRFRATVPGTGDSIGLIVNVEAQNDFHPGYPIIKRGIYYCCRMISSQYGQEFTGGHYEGIRKVYSIWIFMDPPKNRQNTITRYRLTEEHLVGSATEPVKNYDLLSVIHLCLGGPEAENYSGVIRLLDVLLGTDKSEREKREILEEEYNIPMTQSMDKEVSVMCNLSKGVLEKGVKKGLEEGMEKGMEKGVKQGILSSLQNLMQTLNLTADQAMAALKVPEDERPKYRELLGNL